MITNYLKTALRNLKKNKTYSFLNIFGLAIGFVCAGLILLWVEDEINYNGFYSQKDNIQRISFNWTLDNQIRTYTSTPGPLGPSAAASIPSIKTYCRSSEGLNTALFNFQNNPVYSAGRYTDASFFQLFDCKFLEGNPATAFNNPNSLVITERTAEKLFHSSRNVIGKTIMVNNKDAYTITGLIANVPENTTIRYDWLAPLSNYSTMDNLSKWDHFNLETYIQTTPGTNLAQLKVQLDKIITSHPESANNSAALLNMKDWRLRNEFKNGVQSGGRIVYVRLFLLIAGIILLIACINFMNLATARSEQRSREIGVRKALGAGRSTLIKQFIGEAILQAFLSALLAVLLLAILLPAFNALVGKTMTLQLFNPIHLAVMALLVLFCGLLAGSYPALYLSNFNPVAILKGARIKTGGAAFVRRALVISQFSISIVLIIATVIIYQQIQHVKSRDLGFNVAHLISIDAQDNVIHNFPAVRQELLNTAVIENAAVADHNPLYDGNSTDEIYWDGKAANVKTITSMRFIGPGFLETTGMKLLEGKDFTRDADDSSNVMVNEAMARQLGAGSPVGKLLYGKKGNDVMTFRIAGVVKDYVYGDMFGKPDPVMFLGIPSGTNSIYARLNATVAPEKALEKISAVMHKYSPAYPFSYTFTDQQFDDMFRNEMLMQKLSRIFAAIAIFISALGLFGLSAYTAERRTKEIGIRKVLGASTGSIATLLSADFLKLVGVAMLIAFPLAYWMMHHWLLQYQYRVNISPLVFILAGVAAIVITIITISYQSIRASMADPVKSIKSE
ncbi:MAG: ABC transporter permease [Chitinophaga sp.]|uniref:ABC transporter permease n=1 Tax=Chitinophaga sp. TaxID=1869181 RepID=UPI0025C21055|nr:ABC transporter permease [Chitinophaga sp.]MBV8251600.1 ABC transporter permease [Chitinophaga sp.]